jgi:uncharacterized membrane protein YfcA
MLTEAVVVGTVLVAGAVTGMAGFGFALIGTAALAGFVGPRTAVAVMILPMMAANLSLVRELEREGLVECAERFGVFVGAALVGTLTGMAVISAVPVRQLSGIIGVITLGFVVLSQDAVEIPLSGETKDRCFVESRSGMVGVGAVSGVVFGATNVGTQMIAYLRSCGLRRSVFVGVVGMVFLGINGARVGAAWVLGLYPEGVFLVSVAATVPAFVGVGIGKRVRWRISESWQKRVVLVLLTVVGLRLVVGAV